MSIAVLAANFCEEKQKVHPQSGGKIAEACHTGQGERFNHFAPISATKLSSDSRGVVKYPNTFACAHWVRFALAE
jgi:hypothetical protein